MVHDTRICTLQDCHLDYLVLLLHECRLIQVACHSDYLIVRPSEEHRTIVYLSATRLVRFLEGLMMLRL